MRLIGVLAACALLVPTFAMAQQGPAPTRAELQTARAAVARLLRDPDSLRFRNVTTYLQPNGVRIFCGEFNSRNGLGGYVGYRGFMTIGRTVLAQRGYDDIRTSQFWHYEEQLCGPGRGAIQVDL